MSAAFTSGLTAGYGIAIPLGAIAVLIVATAARDSFGHGLAAGFGAASADLTYATVAVAAGSVLSNALRHLTGALHLLGGGVLLVVALRGLSCAFRPCDEPGPLRPTPKKFTYLRFLGLTLINPLTVIYFASVVLGNQTATGPGRAAAFVAGVALASASWQTLLAITGALAGRVLVDRGRVATRLVGYGIVLALAIEQLSKA